MEFASEMVVKATLMKQRIAEVPTTLAPDGRSRAPLLRDAEAVRDRDALYWHYPHYHPGGATPHPWWSPSAYVCRPPVDSRRTAWRSHWHEL